MPLQGHVGQLENEKKSQLDQVLGTMVAGSNGDPNDGSGSASGSSGCQGAQDFGQVIDGKPA